jgi:hypothetical protein
MSIDYVLTFYLLKYNYDVMIHMSSRKWECVCGYTSNYRQGLHQHRKTCKTLLGGETEQLKNQVTQMKEQLATKDQQLATKDQQLAAKDRQIEQLIKRPRTVNNNTTNKYVVEQKINVFGKESIGHISHDQIQALLADPANAVPQFIKLKHRRAPGGVNQNVRVPNQKRAIYQVVVSAEEAEKEWENKAKGEVLEQLYDDNSGHLEAEADEETQVGSQFLDHQDKVKASVGGEDGGRRYKEQLDKIHCVMST